MVEIEESEHFHTGKKMTSSLKMVGFLEKKYLPKAPYIKVRKEYQVHTQNIRFITVVVKKLLQFESGCRPKSLPFGIELTGFDKVPGKKFGIRKSSSSS